MTNWFYYNFEGLHSFLLGAVKYYQFLGGHSVKLLGLSVWSAYKGEGYFWFRVFGYGLHFKNIKCGLNFSQRNGFKKVWCLNSYIITRL